MKLQKFAPTLMIVSAMLLAASAAHAAPSFCSVTGDPNSDGVKTAQMALTNSLGVSSSANDCYGHAASPNGDAAVEAFANGTLASAWGSGWTFLVKDEANSTARTNSSFISGLTFSLSADFGETAGDWTLNIQDNNPLTDPTLPIFLDLIGELKGSTASDFFLFSNVSLDASNPGTFFMTFKPGRSPNPAELSHLTLLARVSTPVCEPGDPACDPQEVPEPATLALLGLALAGLSGASRIRKCA